MTFAREGANIIGLDLCKKPSTTAYDGTTDEDLQETVRLVQEAGGQIFVDIADTRDYAQVKSVFDRGLASTPYMKSPSAFVQACRSSRYFAARVIFSSAC